MSRPVLRLLPAPAPEPWCATAPVDPSELEASELRLLAHAVGDHLPVELADQVAQLRARRAALHPTGPSAA
jgi:hypothetical protein